MIPPSVAAEPWAPSESGPPSAVWHYLPFCSVRISQQIGSNIFGNKYLRNTQHLSGFSGGSVVKNLPVNAGDAGSIPGLGRPAGVGYGNPLQDSCLENPMDKDQTRLSTHTCQSPSP
ncbi:unnamed protein product [Rangifer tarandus platyrhynchus]|uniref:Uncharacterized protein n=2 Tax=Rangifer tarandus platyrhynchus TaxID=3082113 RepID=A0AC59Y8H3_RANTA|nr:unnamed protein product [Rangifer tarandus platyrhynchus]